MCISKPTHVRAKRKDTKERAKEEVALEALTGVKTHAQIASDYGICPNLVKDWRKRGKKMPGKREFELDWLSKKPRSWDCSAASPTPGYK